MELNAIYYGMVLKPDDDKGSQHRRVRYLERLGIESSDQIVVYGAGDLRNAARVCWFMRFLGLNSSVLDGGLAGWLGIPATTTRRKPAVVESQAPPIAPTSGYYLFADEAAALLGVPGVQAIDLRDPRERTSGPFRNVSIPGALDLSRFDLVDGQLLRSPDELTRLFQVAGIDLGAHLILLAPTGLGTATPWLALSLMGAAQVTIVDGGWQQWLNSQGAPVTA